MHFRTTLVTAGKTATGIEVPPGVVEALGAGKKPPVVVTINAGHTYRSTIAARGDRFLVGVSAENREAAGVAGGDEVDVEITLDSAPREVAVPADLAAALAVVPGARERFDALAYSHRKEHVRAIEEAKAEATRERRVAKAVEKVSGA
ncbi:MAG: hypothetical protein JWM73_473 [Solirubrobacterales bacterium]|nr:hypothetical protein [Solirubrobacterales bacterium]